jgi:ABC-type sugar transport system permease subunit
MKNQKYNTNNFPYLYYLNNKENVKPNEKLNVYNLYENFCDNNNTDYQISNNILLIIFCILLIIFFTIYQK